MLAVRVFRFKYPKIALLIFTILFAYYLFSLPLVVDFVHNLGYPKLVGNIVAGAFFAFGFSAPFAVGYFLTTTPYSIVIAALLGGVGALLADWLIFKWIKISFQEEFDLLKEEMPVRTFNELADKILHPKIKTYLLYAFAGILIASPLPDEIGVTILAGLSTINPKVFALLSFSLNAIGIFVILSLGQII